MEVTKFERIRNKMKIIEVLGIPMPHTAKAMGLKKIKKGGKIFYMPTTTDPRRGDENQILIGSFSDGKMQGKKGLSKRIGVSHKKTIS